MNKTEKEIAALGHDGLSWPQTMDAKIWADEFCKRNSASDHGIMIGWFANAIMVGYDAPHEENIKCCCGDFKECDKMCVPRANYWKDKHDSLKLNIKNYLEAIRIYSNFSYDQPAKLLHDAEYKLKEELKNI